MYSVVVLAISCASHYPALNVAVTKLYYGPRVGKISALMLQNRNDLIVKV